MSRRNLFSLKWNSVMTAMIPQEYSSISICSLELYLKSRLPFVAEPTFASCSFQWNNHLGQWGAGALVAWATSGFPLLPSGAWRPCIV